MNDCVKGSVACPVIAALQIKIPVNIWGGMWQPQASSVSLLLTVGRCRVEINSLDPTCTKSTRNISWRWLYYIASSCDRISSTQRSACFAILVQTPDFKYIPQIKIIIKAYSSGRQISITMSTLCSWSCLDTACLQVQDCAKGCIHRKVGHRRIKEQLSTSLPSTVIEGGKWYFRCK